MSLPKRQAAAFFRLADTPVSGKPKALPKAKRHQPRHEPEDEDDFVSF